MARIFLTMLYLIFWQYPHCLLKKLFAMQSGLNFFKSYIVIFFTPVVQHESAQEI